MSPARVHRRPLAALLSPAALLLAALLGLACGGDNSQAASDGAGDGDGDGGGDGGDSADDVTGDGDGSAPADGQYTCAAPEDCVAVSSTCCGCPDFAAGADSDYAAACDEVECEEPEGCPRVIADCVDSICAIVCAPIVADRECDNGFARDSFGCLTNACRTDPPDPLLACQEDTDCTQVPADCCGCDDGGADTAVNVGQVDAHLESLECRRDPACPGLDVCAADRVPRCIAGGCVLASSSDDGGGTDDGGDDFADDDGSGDGPPESEGLCGAPPFESCPAGQVCVLNHPDAGDATQLGLGTCRDE